MPVTPEDIDKVACELLSKEVTIAETYIELIDKALIQHAQPGWTEIKFIIPTPVGMNIRIRAYINKAYKNAGWSVDCSTKDWYDQRDMVSGSSDSWTFRRMPAMKVNVHPEITNISKDRTPY